MARKISPKISELVNELWKKNLDAFSCPSLKKNQQKTTKQLREARDHIDEIKTSYHSLEAKLNEREAYFNKRECELQEFHRIEMNKVKHSLDDLEEEKRLLLEKQKSSDEKLRKFAEEAQAKLTEKENEIQASRERENELIKRVQGLTIVEDKLRDKFHSSELEFSEKLQLASMREKELQEKITQLTKLLEDLKIRSDEEKRGLEEKLNLSMDQLSAYKTSRQSIGIANESFHNKTLNSSQILQDEVQSLQCVLELKQSELSELRKQNAELQRMADGATAAQIKCSALESRVEDLQVQLHAKNNEESELKQKLKQLQDQHDAMQAKTARLSLHNEELQYRLKQNSERYSLTINELSKSYHESSFMTNRTAENSFLDYAGSTHDETQNGQNSPPASPIVKGIVEKSDSVSWVLEMDDESPEVLANRLVRRAGSFRNEKNCSPSPVPKRQKCQNNTSIQQSASAASILNRHQSTEMSPYRSSPVATNGRLRSKSVSASKAIEAQQPVKMTPIVRSISGNGAVKNLGETAWKQSSIMKTSSPNPKKIHSIASMGDELIIDAAKNEFFLNEPADELNEPVVFHRDGSAKFKKAPGLITCDTTALTASENTKHRRPKTHAGEAMISGSNSEDEEHSEEHSRGGSCASSTVSTPSISSSSTSSSDQQPIESIEDALMRWKEHNNTPMEVSWCEEGEPSESIV